MAVENLTLLKILSFKIGANSGNFEYGHNVKIGYYDQEQEDINENNIVLDEVWDSNEKLDQTSNPNYFSLFFFQGKMFLNPYQF